MCKVVSLRNRSEGGRVGVCFLEKRRNNISEYSVEEHEGLINPSKDEIYILLHKYVVHGGGNDRWLRLIMDSLWSKGACGTESKALLISIKTEHTSALLGIDVNRHVWKTVCLWWLIYYEKSPNAWIVHVQIVWDNIKKLFFEKLA